MFIYKPKYYTPAKIIKPYPFNENLNFEKHLENIIFI